MPTSTAAAGHAWAGRQAPSGSQSRAVLRPRPLIVLLPVREQACEAFAENAVALACPTPQSLQLQNRDMAAAGVDDAFLGQVDADLVDRRPLNSQHSGKEILRKLEIIYAGLVTGVRQPAA